MCAEPIYQFVILQFIPITSIIIIIRGKVRHVSRWRCYACVRAISFLAPIHNVFRTIPSRSIFKRYTRQSTAIIKRIIA